MAKRNDAARARNRANARRRYEELKQALRRTDQGYRCPECEFTNTIGHTVMRHIQKAHRGYGGKRATNNGHTNGRPSTNGTAPPTPPSWSDIRATLLTISDAVDEMEATHQALKDRVDQVMEYVLSARATYRYHRTERS